MIKGHLEKNSVSVISVSKLKATQEWMQKSSAFRVSVEFKHKDLVMNSDLWQDNVEVRDCFLNQEMFPTVKQYLHPSC